jgi:hypothetical protein
MRSVDISRISSIISRRSKWIRASAGMTNRVRPRILAQSPLRRKWGRGGRDSSFVIPRSLPIASRMS